MNLIHLSLTLFLLTCSAWAKQSNLPNVVLILSDDQAYNDYSFMGHDMIQTPNIDKLASESVVFERGYVTTGVCCPSITTMITGLYPHQNGTTGNDPLRGVSRKPWIDKFKQCPQLPAQLASKGYLSLQTGKYWQGKPEYSGFTDDMGPTLRHGSDYSLSIGRATMQPIYDFIAKAQKEEKPFFIWYAPFMPHTPHNPPQRLEDKYRKLGAKKQIKYYAMCDWFDESCGQLLNHLEEKGLSDNTIIMYICDNGWGRLDDRKGSVKATPHELGVRTPIMIKWPGVLSPKRNTTNLASNIDIMPTILSAVGVEVPKELPGINLLDEIALEGRKNLFLECFTHDMLDINKPEAALRTRSYVSKKWKLHIWHTPHESLKLQRWQMVNPDEKIQLFDLENDPLEKHNLADKHPELVSQIIKEIDAWWTPNSL